jgi:transposase
LFQFSSPVDERRSRDHWIAKQAAQLPKALRGCEALDHDRAARLAVGTPEEGAGNGVRDQGFARLRQRDQAGGQVYRIAKNSVILLASAGDATGVCRDLAEGFVVLPRRWVVERTFSWFGRNRRLAKDFGNLAETLATFVTLASIQLALRPLARA